MEEGILKVAYWWLIGKSLTYYFSLLDRKMGRFIVSWVVSFFLDFSLFIHLTEFATQFLCWLLNKQKLISPLSPV